MPFPFAFAWLNAIRAVRHSHRIGTFEVTILCACTVGRHLRCMNEWFVHLGVGGAWWSIRNHGRIVFWPDLNIHIILLRKLAIYCDYILVQSTYDGFLCTRATMHGKIVKPTVQLLALCKVSTSLLCYFIMTRVIWLAEDLFLCLW